MANLTLTSQQISVSLENQDGELRLDSRIVADGFGLKNHADYRNHVLLKNESMFAELGVVFKTTLPSGEIVWYLNQAQVNFAGTLARNTEKAVAFKLNLVAQQYQLQRHDANADQRFCWHQIWQEIQEWCRYQTIVRTEEIGIHNRSNTTLDSFRLHPRRILPIGD
jgi:hypothetical protein